jgi:hypothetical protein
VDTGTKKVKMAMDKTRGRFTTMPNIIGMVVIMAII